MTQCNLYMIWFHDKCAGIKKSDNVGWWCCDRCRQMTANVSILMRCSVRSWSPWAIVFRFQTRRLSLTLRAAGSHRFGTPDRTCLQGIRTGLQDLTGKKNQIEHAYKVSGWGCRISRVRNPRTRYQDGAAGCHGIGTTDPTCLRGIRSGLQDHGLGTPDRTCIRDFRTGLQDLKVRDTKSNIAAKYHGGAAESHELGTPDRTYIRGIRTKQQYLAGWELQIVHAY